jgi:hypothetical protein
MRAAMSMPSRSSGIEVDVEMFGLEDLKIQLLY